VPCFWFCCATFSLPLGFSWFSLEGSVIVLHPRMIPRLISGQRFYACSQRFSARPHIVLRGAAWQCTRMCSMDSMTLHVVQNSRCSLPGMCCQCLPIFWVPCMALYIVPQTTDQMFCTFALFWIYLNN